MEINIREAVANDLQSLKDLTTQLGYPLTLERVRENLDVILSHDNEKIFVACANDKVIAWVHVFHTVRLESSCFAELGGLVVDDHYRGKGVGQLLVDKTIQWARDRNIPLLRLRSNTIRGDAHRFYRRLGFTEIKEQKVFDMPLN